MNAIDPMGVMHASTETNGGVAAIARIASIAFIAFIAPSAHAQTTHALVITGVAGEPRLAKQFQRDATAIRDAVTRRFGGEAIVLMEHSTPRSDRAGVTQAFGRLAAASGAGDRILIVLIGHGSAQGGEPRFNIPGPDVTAGDLAVLLEPLEGRQVAVVLGLSASGTFVPALSAPGRTILTATRSAAENEEVVFPEYFARALSEDVADTDKDGGVSLAEAFEYAKREVARYYQQHNRLATEHALLDDNGDGKGSLAIDAAGDGARAREFVLRADSGKAASEGMRGLMAERAALQQQIDALKARKADMPAAAYDAELEKLLLQLARKSAEIRSREGRQ